MIKWLTSARKSNTCPQYIYSLESLGVVDQLRRYWLTLIVFENKFILFDEYITSLLLASGPTFILSFSSHNVMIHIHTVNSGSMDLSLKHLWCPILNAEQTFPVRENSLTSSSKMINNLISSAQNDLSMA